MSSSPPLPPRTPRSRPPPGLSATARPEDLSTRDNLNSALVTQFNVIEEDAFTYKDRLLTGKLTVDDLDGWLDNYHKRRWDYIDDLVEQEKIGARNREDRAWVAAKSARLNALEEAEAVARKRRRVGHFEGYEPQVRPPQDEDPRIIYPIALHHGLRRVPELFMQESAMKIFYSKGFGIQALGDGPIHEKSHDLRWRLYAFVREYYFDPSFVSTRSTEFWKGNEALKPDPELVRLARTCAGASWYRLLFSPHNRVDLVMGIISIKLRETCLNYRPWVNDTIKTSLDKALDVIGDHTGCTDMERRRWVALSTHLLMQHPGGIRHMGHVTQNHGNMSHEFATKHIEWVKEILNLLRPCRQSAHAAGSPELASENRQMTRKLRTIVDKAHYFAILLQEQLSCYTIFHVKFKNGIPNDPRNNFTNEETPVQSIYTGPTFNRAVMQEWHTNVTPADGETIRRLIFPGVFKFAFNEQTGNFITREVEVILKQTVCVCLVVNSPTAQPTPKNYPDVKERVYTYQTNREQGKALTKAHEEAMKEAAASASTMTPDERAKIEERERRRKEKT